MKKTAVITCVLAVAVVALLAVLLILSGNVVLYKAQSTAFSEIHKDPSIVSVMTTEESETILPLMDEILSQTYDVVVEIDAKDFEYSERELNTYENLLKRLKTNSGKIKLTDTDINEFVQSSGELKISMDVLNNNIQKLEELKQTVIENAGNKEALYSLANEVLVLSQEIELTAETYAETAEIMIEISSKYDISTSTIEMALDYVNKMASNVGTESKSLFEGISTGEKDAVFVNFIINPETVKYGDNMIISGNINNKNISSIEFYLDSNLWRDISLNNKSTFNERFTIGKIKAGVHIVSLRSGTYFSKLQYFTVKSSPTVLSVLGTKVSDGENKRLLTVTGKLATDTEVNVAEAPVMLYSNETGYLTSAVTDSKGVWKASVELDDGTYNIYAEFSDPAFPLDESRSESVEVTISTPQFYYLILIAAAAVFGFFIFRFVKKSGRIKIKAVKETEPEKTASPVTRITEKIKKMFTPDKKESVSERLVSIYKNTVDIIVNHEEIENSSSKTPREILALVSDHAELIKPFTEKYEYLHYSNTVVTEEDLEEMNTMSLKIIEAYDEQNNN